MSELLRSANVNLANLDGSIVVVAGGDVGHASMDSRQPLPVTDVPELKAVELAWGHTTNTCRWSRRQKRC